MLKKLYEKPIQNSHWEWYFYACTNTQHLINIKESLRETWEFSQFLFFFSLHFGRFVMSDKLVLLSKKNCIKKNFVWGFVENFNDYDVSFLLFTFFYYYIFFWVSSSKNFNEWSEKFSFHLKFYGKKIAMKTFFFCVIFQLEFVICCNYSTFSKLRQNHFT